MMKGKRDNSLEEERDGSLGNTRPGSSEHYELRSEVLVCNEGSGIDVIDYVARHQRDWTEACKSRLQRNYA